MIEKGTLTERGLLLIALVVTMFGLLAISGVQSGYMTMSAELDAVTGYGVLTPPPSPPTSIPTYVGSCIDLQNIKNDLSGLYVLSKDIDCSASSTWNGGDGFEPIGNITHPFKGMLNGAGYTIVGFTINRSSEDQVALFRNIENATIMRLNFIDSFVVGDEGVSTLAYNATTSLIYDLVLNGYVEGSNQVGGLVGFLIDSTLRTSAVNIDILSSAGSAVGGAILFALDSDINDSFAKGFVNATDSNPAGFVNFIMYTDLLNIYSAVALNVSPSKGLVSSALYSLSTSSYWDEDVSGTTSSAVGNPLSTSQMKTQTSFSGWDFSSTWAIKNDNYPMLQMMNRDLDITLISPTPGETVPGNANVDFEFSLDDPYNWGSNFKCDLYIDGIYKATDNTILEGDVVTISSVPATVDTKNWEIRCESPSGHITTASRSAFFSNDPPEVSVYYPVSDETVHTTTINFNYSVKDDFTTTTFDCDLYINDTVVDSDTPLNDTNSSMSYTFSYDDVFEWYVRCASGLSTFDESSPRLLYVQVAPEMPEVYAVPSFSTNENISLIGYINIDAYVNASANNGIEISLNGTATQSAEAILLETKSINHVYSDAKSFDVISPLQGNLLSGNYVQFEQHNKSHFLNYKIETVVSAGSNTWKVTLNETLQENIFVGETIYIYDREQPTGWFNLSLTLLSGNNVVQIWGVNEGVSGQAKEYLVSYDAFPPVINLTKTIYTSYPNVSSSGYLTNFTIEDETFLNLSSLIVNLTNGVDVYEPSFTCSPIIVDQKYECILDVSGIPEGEYNASFYVEDQASRNASSTLVDFTILRTLSTSFIIEDEGSTTNNTYIYVNWTSPMSFLLQPMTYSLAVFDDYGNNITPWVSVDNTTNEYFFTMNDYPTIHYGEGYFVRIIPYDALGNAGTTQTTNGILLQDTSAPIFHFVEIVDTGFGYSRATSSFHLRWNFTDNETGVSVYEYAIGTQPYPVPGWDDTLSITQTTDEDFVQTGLSLVDGQEYYLSVRARNGYGYAAVWSGWKTSSAVIVDRIAPLGTAISYQTGPRTVDSINITFNTGVDSISGVHYAEILRDETGLTSGSCNIFPGNYNFVQATSLPAGLSSYLVSGLDSGKCYRFKLVVHDHAGNSAEDIGGTNFNISVDTTPPTPLTVYDEGFLTPDTTTYFSWDGGDDPQSGIDHYEYSLGTAPDYNDIFDWTIHPSYVKSVSFSNLPLIHTQTYYFCVQAYNDYGLYSEACSNGILYLDLITPEPLEVLSVGTDGTAPYIDTTPDINWTLITLSGEQDLDCVWSMYDEYYIDVYLTAPVCVEQMYMPGEYHCNITDLVEGENTVHVMCSDSAGNGQSNMDNTDITFTKEMGGPLIDIIYPQSDGDIIPGVLVNFTVDIVDASPITMKAYQLRDAGTGNLLTDGIFTSSTITLDLSSYSGEVRLVVLAQDSLSRSSQEERLFIINNDEPYATTENVNARNYLNGIFYSNQSFTFTANTYFFNNYTYTITNSASDVIQTASYTNASKTTHKAISIFINASEPVYSLDGVYTLHIDVYDDDGASYTLTRPIIIDRVAPLWIEDTCAVGVGSTEECITTRGLFEPDEDVQAFMIWQDEHGIDKTLARVAYDDLNSTGKKQNLSAVNTTDGILLYPNSERYKVEFDGLLRTNQSILYVWHIWDLAGNKNTRSKSVFVNNTPPSLLTTGSMIDWGIVGEEYNQIIEFVDDDRSQQGYPFDCIVNDTRFSISFEGYGVCRLTNASVLSTGTYPLNITIYDTNGTSSYTMDASADVSPLPEVIIYPSVVHVLELDDVLGVAQVSMIPGGTSTASDSGTGTDTLNFLVRSDVDQDLIITMNDFYVKVLDVNLLDTPTFNAEKINPSWIRSTNTSFWDGYTIHSAFGAEIDYIDQDYWIGFNLTKLGLTKTSSMKLFQFKEYDLGSSYINYSSLEFTGVGSSLPQSEDIVYIARSNFSVFVLATQGSLTYTCGNGICESGLGETSTNCPADCSSGGSGGSGSSGGGSSGGGSFIFPTKTAPVANCSDGIQNQGETGIDCGGPCPACVMGEEEEETTPPTTQQPSQQTPQQTRPVLPSDVLQKTDDVQVPDEKASTAGKLVLWFLILFVALGAIVLFIVESKRKHSDALVRGTIEDITGHPADDDPAHLAVYIRQQRTNYSDEIIKQFLLQHKYSEANINVAISALEDTKHISLVKAYFKQYVSDGFELEDLVEWLSNQGIDPAIVAVAKAEFVED
jgi:hypothetical protein